MEKTVDEQIKRFLEQAKLKVTANRCGILKVLLKSKNPLNYKQINESFPLDKATFYRNMKNFEKKEIVHRFESQEGVWHYEIGKATHAHFICEKCEKIVCFESQTPPKVKGYTIKSMTLKGVCKECE